MAESRITPFLTTWRVIIQQIYTIVDRHATIPNVFFLGTIFIGFAIIVDPSRSSVQAVRIGIKPEVYGALFVLVGAMCLTADKTPSVLIFGQSLMWLHTLWVMWYLLLTSGNPLGLPVPAYLALCVVMALEVRAAYREH